MRIVRAYSASGSEAYTVQGRLRATLDVGASGLVEGDDAALAARLDRHVADREAVVHAEALDRVPGELHRLIERAVDADHPDDVQDEVLAAHPGQELAGDLELDRSRAP